MAEFKRARSAEHKKQRMDEIKVVALTQFRALPYHKITLTTIAEELDWSRANLYKYAHTKEEIFLALATDLRDSYFDALMAAFPEGCAFSRETIAEVWAALIAAHADWFRLHALLFSILEQNASVNALIAFKQGYYDQIEPLAQRFEQVAGIPAGDFEKVFTALTFQASGIATNCCEVPAVREALKTIGRYHTGPDLKTEMREFIAMCLDRWAIQPRQG